MGTTDYFLQAAQPASMKVRGERECKDCGTRWSYFETGRVECPSCGSLLSVGVGERAVHTDTGGDLDLSEARRIAGEEPLDRAAAVAEATCREYCRSRGFIDGGDLRDLDGRFVAAQELKHAASVVDTRLSLDDATEGYVLQLLRDAEDGERPVPAAVPHAVRSARGLGVADAVRAYRQDLRTYVDDPETDTPDDALRYVERLGDHEKRLRALDGAVDPVVADDVLEAARVVGEYLRTGSVSAARDADQRLDDLA